MGEKEPNKTVASLRLWVLGSSQPVSRIAQDCHKNIGPHSKDGTSLQVEKNNLREKSSTQRNTHQGRAAAWKHAGDARWVHREGSSAQNKTLLVFAPCVFLPCRGAHMSPDHTQHYKCNACSPRLQRAGGGIINRA